MMHRDRAWRRRKAHFEHVREVETLEVKGFQLRDVPPKGLEEKHHPPGKLTVAQTLRLSSQLADELKEGEIRETLLETQPTDAVTEAAI